MFASNHSLKHRVKTNFYTNSTGTNTFDPKACKAYSYSWWCYVARIKGMLVFNDYSYSSSTSGHQSVTRSLLRELGLKVDVVVKVRDGLQAFETKALPPLYKEMFQLETFIKRKGVRADSKARRVNRISEIQREIATFRSLGAKFSRVDQAKLRAEVVKAESERLERARTERKAKPIRSTNKIIKESATFEIVM